MPAANAESAPDYLISPVQRAIRLLEYVAEGGGTTNLSEAARRLDINRATLSRLLDTLEHEGVLERPPEGGKHRFGPRFLGIAAMALSSHDLLSLARPVLGELAEEVGLSAYLCVLSGRDVLYLARAMPDVPLVSNIRVGSRIPAHLTAPGRVLLSKLSPEARRARLGPEPFNGVTPASVTSYAALDVLLRKDLDQGCAWSASGYERGVDACAVPVQDLSGEIVAALSLAGPEAMFDGRHEGIRSFLTRTSGEISRKLISQNYPNKE